jgi:LVIVD repeat
MESGAGIRQVGYFDCAGGGQVVVENDIAYVAHMRSPHGTSVIDVSDPRNPRELASIAMPQGTHSHKVRVGNGLMVVNHETNFADTRPIPPQFRSGLGIYDISNPGAPRLITRWETVGGGVHRFDFDGRYAYMSPTLAGYVGNVAMIMDLGDPAHPAEVGRWWMPGQWIAGGEKPVAARQPALHQLLDGRLRHPRHRRHDEAQAGLGSRLVAAVRLPDPHRAADPVRHSRPALPAGRRRGRVPPGRRGAGLHVDG